MQLLKALAGVVLRPGVRVAVPPTEEEERAAALLATAQPHTNRCGQRRGLHVCASGIDGTRHRLHQAGRRPVHSPHRAGRGETHCKSPRPAARPVLLCGREDGERGQGEGAAAGGADEGGGGGGAGAGGAGAAGGGKGRKARPVTEELLPVLVAYLRQHPKLAIDKVN